MKTAGVVIDSWKLPIFKSHLDDSGFAYTEHPGVTKDTITLKVKYEKVTDITARRFSDLPTYWFGEIPVKKVPTST